MPLAPNQCGEEKHHIPGAQGTAVPVQSQALAAGRDHGMGISDLSGMGSGESPPPPPAGAQLIPPGTNWEPGCLGLSSLADRAVSPCRQHQTPAKTAPVPSSGWTQPFGATAGADLETAPQLS